MTADLLRRAWSSVLFPHALLGILALAAFHAQSTYRIPNLLGVLALPVVGVTLAALSVVILLTRLGDQAGPIALALRLRLRRP